VKESTKKKMESEFENVMYWIRVGVGDYLDAGAPQEAKELVQKALQEIELTLDKELREDYTKRIKSAFGSLVGLDSIN
jgi:hypothetical protein